MCSNWASLCTQRFRGMLRYVSRTTWSDTHNITQVRSAEESPKKLRIEKASEHVKQHCLASLSPKRRHSTKKSYFRDRADSREVLQGSSFFNDLVKRSSIQKERISTEGLATHHETSSPKRYRDRKILKRDDVFSGNRWCVSISLYITYILQYYFLHISTSQGSRYC